MVHGMRACWPLLTHKQTCRRSRWAPLPQTVAQNLFMSTTSKVFATCGTYPYQVVRSRLMDQRSTGSSMVAALYTGPVDAVRKIWRYAARRVGQDLARGPPPG